MFVLLATSRPLRSYVFVESQCDLVAGNHLANDQILGVVHGMTGEHDVVSHSLRVLEGGDARTVGFAITRVLDGVCDVGQSDTSDEAAKDGRGLPSKTDVSSSVMVAQSPTGRGFFHEKSAWALRIVALFIR